MKQDLLPQAKQRLSLPVLMDRHGHGDRAKKSARCMFHDDGNASFSVFQRENGAWAWKCHAGCGGGDEIDWLAKHRGLSNSDACREFIRLAGIKPAAEPVSNLEPPPSAHPQFNWLACVEALTADHRTKLAAWRGYAPKFVEWLHTHQLIGAFGESVAFPIHDTHGTVVGCHYRQNGDGSWRYFPHGTHTAPFIVGDVTTAKTVLVVESQWDGLAVLNCFHHHVQPLADTAIIATRGASNGRLIAGLCAADATIYAFTQNDQAGTKWLSGVAESCGCKCVNVITPAPHKDVNDWTRAGASSDDIRNAIAAAQPVLVTELPNATITAPTIITKPSLALSDDDDETDDAPVPFPTECLPPVMAAMVRATATTMQVPESLPGLMALAVTSASIGKGLVLNWREGKPPTPANLFVLLSAASGTGKTECYKLIAEPFLAFERAMQGNWHKSVMPKLQADLRFHEGQLKKLDRKLAKDSTSMDDAERLRSELVFHQAQVDDLTLNLFEPQLSIQDATVEKVAVVMHRNGETTFSTSSDARKLVDNLLCRYSANKNLADDGIYLSAFSGDDVKVDRQGREGVRLSNPCLTLLWALQPDALEMLLDEGSLQQGGYLARCLLANTLAEPQYIGDCVRPISEAVRADWGNQIRNLLGAYRQPPTMPDATPTVSAAQKIQMDEEI